MTAAQAGFGRGGRSRQLRRGRLLTLVLLTVIAVVVWSGVRVPQFALRAQADRAFVRQASLITETVAWTLFAAQPAPDRKVLSQDPMALELEQLRAALASHSALRSITVATQDLRVVARASASKTPPEAMVSAFKALQDRGLPPRDGDVSMVTEPDRLFIARRIGDAPGSVGGLLFLEFETNPQIGLSEAALLTLCGLLLYGILLWTLLEHVIRQSVLRPTVALRRLHARLGRGNWTRGIVPAGSAEVRAIAESTNASIERATRLWSTIEWRRRHLEAQAPDKAQEARRITARVSRDTVFGTPPLLPLPIPRRRARSVAIALLLLCEVGALLELVLVFAPPVDSGVTSERWKVALLVGAFGAGLISGGWMSLARETPAPGPTKLIATATLSTAACLLVAYLGEYFTVLALTRAAAGFAVGFTVNDRGAWITGRASNHGMPVGGAASRQGAVLGLGLCGPLLGLLAINYPTDQVFLALAALSALAVLLAMGSAILQPTLAQSITAESHRAVTSPGMSPADDESTTRSPASVPTDPKAHQPVLDRDRAPSRVDALGAGLPAILIVAMTLLQAIALASIEIDQASRFLGICLMLTALTAGVCLPDVVGRHAPLGALLGLSVIVVPMLMVQTFAPVSLSTRTILMASATALLAGCVLGMIGQPRPSNVSSTLPAHNRWGARARALRGSALLGCGFVGTGFLVVVTVHLNESALVTASTVGSVMITLGVVAGQARGAVGKK